MATILGKSTTAAAPEESFQIFLSTTGLSDGTTVPYSISGILPADIDEALTGNFTVTNNVATATFTVAELFIGSKEFRLDVAGAFVTVVLAQDCEYIYDPTFVYTADTFNDFRRKHNALSKLYEELEIEAQARGVRKQHYDIVADGQTAITLTTLVNPAHTIVTVNGNVLDPTDYTLTTNLFTYTSVGDYELKENDDVNFYDFATGGGVARQQFDATAGQTVFNLSPNVNPDHTIVSINGNILDETDYALTPTTLTYVSTDYTLKDGDDINLYDYANGNLFGFNRVIKEGAAIKPNRHNMRFVGNVTVTDSPSTDETIIDIGATGGGSGSFLSSTDTPSSYTGEALKLVRVNGAEDAVEFIDPTSIIPSASYVDPEWTIVSGNANLTAGSHSIINASSLGGTLTFPASPANNNTLTFVLGNGNLETNPYILDAGTINFVDNIQTPSTTYELNTNFSGKIAFVYNSTLNTWILL